LTFGDTGIGATLTWEADGDLLVLRLVSVSGAPTELAFLRLPLAQGGEFTCSGRVCAYDDASVALIPQRAECLVKAGGRNHPYMSASVFSEVSLDPVRIALMAAPFEAIGGHIAAAEEASVPF